jgi:ABC-type glycerol-3-phosphate transport system substrate-binding protein
MKKIFFSVFLLLVVLSNGIWAEGQTTRTKPKMDKIVYLSVGNHDNPEVLPYWAAEFKRITGVDVELKTVSSKSATDLMTAQFMAGEFPDVVKFGGESVRVLVRQGFVVPLDDYIEKSPGMKKLKEMFPSSFRSHSADGAVYGIPAMVGQHRGLWVRTDILDELDLPMPKTMDEFVYTLKHIRDNYPQPDGSQMFPYISKTYHAGYIGVLSNYFNVTSSNVTKNPNDKKYRIGWDSPQFKEYAEFIKMLYDEKLMDPDHVLPQKASKTRAKLYAGKGAFIAMWVKNYASMIISLRETFPNAELALVPPIENPKGGVMGLSVIPGYRPFCIMTEADDPDFVWEKFIETLYLDTEGVMLLVRGIPNINYKIVDNTFTDISEETGLSVGEKSPFNPEIKFPYKLPPLMEKGSQFMSEFSRWASNYSNYIVWDSAVDVVPAYDLIASDMKAKRNELFWKYVLGELSYEQMMSDFDKYLKEISYPSILDQFNAGL